MINGIAHKQVERADDSERILCAATWFTDEVRHPEESPINVTSGYVLCGYNHTAISELFSSLTGNAPELKKMTQGFLTSKNRFLNRAEAMTVARLAGQVASRRDELTSEDLLGF